MYACRFIALPLALLAGAAGLSAQSDGEPQLTAGVGFASRHVFRGVERAGGSAQAVVEYAVAGFRGTVWANRPLRGGPGGEVDLTAAFALPVGKKSTLELALTAYRFTAVPAGATEHSWEAGLTATGAPVRGFVPRVSWRHDFRLEADSSEAALAFSLPLPRLGAFLELSAFAGWVDARNARPDAAGARAGDGYGYAGAEVHLPYRVSARCTVVAGLHGTATVNRGGAFAVPGRAARANLWLTLGASFDF